MNEITVIFWYWGIAAVLLLMLEMFVAGTFFLWMSVAAAFVGLAVWIAPDLSLNYQLLMFAALSILAITAFQYYRKNTPQKSASSTLNRRSSQYIGRVFVLKSAILNGEGHLSVDDTTWSIEGEDFPAGTRVIVTGLRGNTLLVDKH